jgi:hypothetical protein
MSRLQRWIVLLPVVLLLGGCSILPKGLFGWFASSAPTHEVAGGADGQALAPEQGDRLAGVWWVSNWFPSGIPGADPAMRDRLIGQPVRIDWNEATNLRGERCAEAELVVSQEGPASYFDYRDGAAGLRLPSAPSLRLHLFCNGYPFGDYWARDEGTLLSAWDGGYLLLTRAAPAAALQGEIERSAKPMRRPPPSRPVALHLSSEISEEAARDTWVKLQRSHPQLNGLESRYRLTDVPGKGRFVRLYAITDRERSATICRQLKARGQYCAVMPVP